MDFILQQATINDINQIMEIEQNGFIPEIQENQSVFEKRILLCPQLFLIIKDNTTKQTVGYLCAEQINKIPDKAEEIKLNHTPDSVPVNTKEKFIYISSFSILPQFRGKGNGKKIWEQCMKYLEQMTLSPFDKTTLSPFAQKKILILLVNQDWQAAKHIYEQNGFNVENIFKNFFPRQDGSFSDGILMIKQI